MVDDSLVTVDVVSDFMQDQGWEVETALSAAQALEKLTAFRPEVVVSDLNMPDLDGLGLFKRIRQVDATVPVIMLSGEDRLESVLASMHAGVFDFVQKRDCVHTLPAAALRAVAHCRVVRENRRLNDDLMRMNEALERRVQEQTALLEERMRRAAALETAAAVAPLRKELEIAQHIQTSILPKNFEVAGLKIAAHMLPAAVVGGDYFDVRPVPDGAWIGVGDVSGHGLTAGLLMLMIQSGISALTLQHPEAQPHELLPHLNRLMWENVRERLGRDDFATLCLHPLLPRRPPAARRRPRGHPDVPRGRRTLRADRRAGHLAGGRARHPPRHQDPQHPARRWRHGGAVHRRHHRGAGRRPQLLRARRPVRGHREEPLAAGGGPARGGHARRPELVAHARKTT